MSIYIPCWLRPTTQNIALSGIRMHTICLIKCILFHIYLCRLYVIIRRHCVEIPSTLLALCVGNHLRLKDSPRNRSLWRNFGGYRGQTFANKSVHWWIEGNDFRRHDAPWRHWNLQPNPYFKNVNWNITHIYYIWNRPWPFIYEHHNRAPMLLSVTFDEIATLVCGRSGLWPFRFVAVPVCGHFSLWPFRSVAFSVCGRFGLWTVRFVAV